MQRELLSLQPAKEQRVAELRCDRATGLVHCFFQEHIFLDYCNKILFATSILRNRRWKLLTRPPVVYFSAEIRQGERSQQEKLAGQLRQAQAQLEDKTRCSKVLEREREREREEEEDRERQREKSDREQERKEIDSQRAAEGQRLTAEGLARTVSNLQEELEEKNRSLAVWEQDWKERETAGVVELQEREKCLETERIDWAGEREMLLQARDREAQREKDWKVESELEKKSVLDLERTAQGQRMIDEDLTRTVSKLQEELEAKNRSLAVWEQDWQK